MGFIKYGGYGREGGEGDFFWTPLLLGGEDGDRSGACFLETRKRRFEHTGFALKKEAEKWENETRAGKRNQRDNSFRSNRVFRAQMSFALIPCYYCQSTVLGCNTVSPP